MAEGARLESVYTGNRIVGSNPTPSAMAIDFIMFLTTFPKIPSSVPYSEIALRRPLVRGFCRGLCRQRPVENSAQALAAASGVTAWRRPEFSSNR